MLFRLTHLTLTLWIAVLFTVVIPIHQRGSIGVPGSDTLARNAESCPLCVGTDQDSKPSKSDPARDCGICYFRVMLSYPPVVDLSVPELKELHIREEVRSDLVAASVFAPSLTLPRPPPIHA